MSDTAPRAAYPAEIDTLLPLRFLALGWVIINQFQDRLGLHIEQTLGFVGHGYMGSDLFFVLSGFWLAHVLTTQVDGGQASYASVVWRRMSRLYPMHLATMALMFVILIASLRMGETPRTDVFDPVGLMGNVLLVHAWGALPTVSWNFPSWMVSAEWFALLIFPGLLALAMRGWSRTWIALIAPIAIMVAMFESAHARGVLFTDMTAQVGVFRTLPDFLFGAGLYRLGLERPLGRVWGWGLIVLSLGWIGAACQLKLSDPWIWPAFGPLVLGVAETARSGRALLASAPMRFLGRISYSAYLLYLPVDIIYYHLLPRVLGTPTGVQVWIAWAGVFPAILIAGVLAYYGLERPAAALLNKLDPFRRRGPAESEAEAALPA
jgi:peptidoglycan/LPS O-acetylase OafA/YrhL